MRSRSKWPSLVAAFALMVTACGGAGGEATTTAAPAQTTEAPSATTATTAVTETTAAPGGDLLTDVGVSDTEITLGMLADLTGIFSPLVKDIVAAQEVYWENVNAAGGIAGRQVVLDVRDTTYNADVHAQQYEELRDKVVALSQSTGSPYTSQTVPKMIEDNMVAVALTWYSGWAFPEFEGGTVLEQQTNYCLEAMNVISYLSSQMEAESGAKPTLAILTFPGEYGEDSGAGAELAAEALGLEVVLSGRGTVPQDPNADFTPIVSQLISADPDLVWITTNPTIMAKIFGGAVQQGLQAQWSGAVPSYDFRLLDQPIAPALGQFWTQPGYNVTWGTDVPGMEELISAMVAARPELRPSDAMVLGWLEAKTMEAVLNAAAESGDMTRAGVLAAANSLAGIDFNGLAPDQTYAGDPNDYITREIALFKPNPERYTAAGGANQTLGAAEGGGTTGTDLVAEFFVEDIAADYVFEGPCFTSS